MTVEIGRPRAADSSDSIVGAATRQQPARRVLRYRLYLLLAFVDAACIQVAFLSATVLYPIAPDVVTEFISVSLTIIYLITAFTGRAFSADIIDNPGRGVQRAASAFFSAAATFLLLAFFLKTSVNFSRVIFLSGCLASLFLIVLARFAVLRQSQAIVGGTPYHVVRIEDRDGLLLADDPAMSEALAGFDPDAPSPEMYDRLARALGDIDRVIVSCPPERRLAWGHALQGGNIQAEIAAPELARMGPLDLSRFQGAPTIVVARGPLKISSRIVKRAFDLAVAGPALILLMPVLILTAIAIRIESPGPVLFVQTRIGRANRMFKVYKFRSMRTDALDHAANTLTQRNDARITRVGNFLRKTSIDELPQLLNVFKGEMSLVGPRPHAAGAKAADKLYWEVDHRYWHRHAAKPGLTGLAQVRGHRGNTELESDLTDRLQADLEYLKDWSLWKDIVIILMTFRVLMHKNAF